MILCSLIVGDLISYSQKKSEEIQFITEMQIISSLTKSVVDVQDLQPIEKIDTAPKTTGEFGEVERLIKTFMNIMIDQRNDYFHDLEAIGWEKILDPERLNQDKTLSESKIIIQNTKDTVSKYRNKMYELFDNLRNDIRRMNASETLKREMEKWLDRGLLKSRADILEADALWDEVLSEVEKIFNLLGTKNCVWEITNGQIMFSRDRDLNTFNSYILSIQKLTEKQKAIQRRNIETFNDNLKYKK